LNRHKPIRRLGWLTIAALVIAGLITSVAVWQIVPAPDEKPLPGIINDITQLNPIAVESVLAPTTTDQIVEAVRDHSGPISIGAARHSMGGQIATTGALYIDMRQFDKILSFSPSEKTITVQAGVRWRQIQERIDQANLAIGVMQTYANFTVGGSLSVNAHGRYVGQGPLITSVKSLKLVLAKGSIVEASPEHNADIFDGAIGGYGGLGVIIEATLRLTDNVKVKRHATTIPITRYRDWFFQNIRGSPEAVFHNADIYPNVYDTVHAVTFAQTSDPLTITERLIPQNKSYWEDRFGYWAISEAALGKRIRQYVLDPIHFRNQPVSWRNYEASYDAVELEPVSRAHSTYVLQEYFIPVERFDEFVPQMRGVLRRHKVDVINVSIRHATPDPGSLLAWARTKVFSFVIYYKQGTDLRAQNEVGIWARELIDAALKLNGSYYLPYQLHATQAQFDRAYPRASEFFALKRRLDPSYKF
jgi:FAD/FMN-containing dehydrogenase